MTNDQARRDYVKKQIEHELTRLYRERSELPRGIYKNFLGNGLDQKIRYYMNQPMSYSAIPLDKLHKDDCAVCIEPIMQDSDRIYLPLKGKKPIYTKAHDSNCGECYICEYTTCGHSFCTKCTEDWFFAHAKDTCPLCRRKIDVTLLRSIVAHQQNNYQLNPVYRPARRIA